VRAGACAAAAHADVALDDAPVVDDEGVGDDGVERCVLALARGAARLPLPSRMTLPPPNVTSSPQVVKSCSTSITNLVSASRTRSPVVGP
jgi:hypothetical protein